jgi:hypothetical protein
MKKTILFTLLIFSFTYAKAQSIRNGNFEQWDSVQLDLLNDWFSSNDEYISGPVCLTKTNDSRSGYALKIETKSTGIGNRLQYGFITNQFGIRLDEGGIPYSQQPTALTGFYKASIMAGDSVFMSLIFKKNNVVISTNYLNIGANSNTFTAFSIPTNLTSVPDSVIFLVSSSSNQNSVPSSAGTSLILDDLLFVGNGITQQFPNNDFNSWTSKNHYLPINWSAYSAYITKTNDKHSGLSAIAIPVANYRASGVWGTNLILGIPSSTDGMLRGMPYNKQNDSLTFYYKYLSVNNDTANVFASLYKNGNTVGSTIAFLEPTDTFKQVTLPLMGNQVPDTINVSFSVASGQAHPPSLGTVLIIDEVRIASEPINSGLLEKTRGNHTVEIYPNPMNTELNVWVREYKNVEYRIVDITGKELLSGNVNGNPIQVGDLHPGIYFISLSTNGQVLATQKVVKN